MAIMRISVIILLSIISVFISVSEAFSQSMLKSSFRYYGFSVFDYFTSPVYLINQNNVVENAEGELVLKPTGYYRGSYLTAIGALSFTYAARSTFKEIKSAKNKSYSVCVPVTVGLPYGYASGFMSKTKCSGYLDFAFFLEYNKGLAATGRTSDDNGFMIGLGYEIIFFPFFFTDRHYKNELDEEKKLQFYRFWIQPTIHTSFKFKNKKNQIREANLKIGGGNFYTYKNEKGEDEFAYTIYTKLAYMIYPDR